MLKDGNENEFKKSILIFLQVSDNNNHYKPNIKDQRKGAFKYNPPTSFFVKNDGCVSVCAKWAIRERGSLYVRKCMYACVSVCENYHKWDLWPKTIQKTNRRQVCAFVVIDDLMDKYS